MERRRKTRSADDVQSQSRSGRSGRSRRVGFGWRVLTGGLHHLFSHLQQDGDADVVLGHHAVQHGLGAFGVRHGQLVELHRVLLHRTEPT